jgi:hypothetical protein
MHPVMDPVMDREHFSGTRGIWALFMEEATTPFDFHLDLRINNNAAARVMRCIHVPHG